MRADPCPVCATPRPANRASDEPWCCSIECYRAFWHDPAPPRDEPTAPCRTSRHARPRPEEVITAED